MALTDADLDDDAPLKLAELAGWCDELAGELRRRLDFIIDVDESAFRFLVALRGGIARGLLPDGDLPAHVSGAWPRSAAQWRELAFARLGFEQADWRPGAGFAANREIVEAVYDYYLELYERDDRLLWAAMGRLAGAAVWAGLEDLQVLNTTLPLYPLQGPWLQQRLLEMQLAIFEDLAWQHEAYLAGGIEALRAAFTREEIDDDTLQAWEHLDAGELAEGTRLLVYREQDDVLQDDHYARWPVHAPDLALMTSADAESPVPGGQPFRTVVPGDLGDRSADRPQLHDWEGARQTWIDADMLPAFERFLDGDDGDQVLAIPVPERAEAYRDTAAVVWHDTLARQPMVPPTGPFPWLDSLLGSDHHEQEQSR